MESTEEQDPKWWSHRSWNLLSKVRQNNPLIQCITNFVSMDLMANTLLSAGASPAMLHTAEEIPEFTPRAAALCLNLGTLSATWLPAMKLAASVAVISGTPWVLDPVAAGATEFRLRACLELAGMGPTVIRGNASEIIALAGASSSSSDDTSSKGVDSCHKSTDAIASAKALALSTGAVVAVSGAVDIVTDGERVVGAHNGVPMMQKITATGCSVTALVAAFVAVDKVRSLEATAAALAIFGLAGEIGMRTACGPASLRTNLIDSLYALDEESVTSLVKIQPFVDD